MENIGSTSNNMQPKVSQLLYTQESVLYRLSKVLSNIPRRKYWKSVICYPTQRHFFTIFYIRSKSHLLRILTWHKTLEIKCFRSFYILYPNISSLEKNKKKIEGKGQNVTRRLSLHMILTRSLLLKKKKKWRPSWEPSPPQPDLPV